jgi:16S rRNA (guanine966-N2)-methyltransferase
VAKPRSRGGKPGARSRLRIIAGRWRGRLVAFDDVPGLRPTPDRVRETVFNWLTPYLPGARCLDLFAGSGALGLEALSRGAAQAVMVDANRRVTDTLAEQAGILGAEHARIVHADVLAFLDGPAQPFDLVFLDPPYGQDLLAPCCERLETRGWLAPGARIYLEAERELGVPAVPADWEVVRSKHAGQVGYHLAVRRATA